LKVARASGHSSRRRVWRGALSRPWRPRRGVLHPTETWSPSRRIGSCVALTGSSNRPADHLNVGGSIRRTAY
jgi:hypothetical protein